MPHCHLQVLGRADRHFGYAETVRARCPADYWQRTGDIHHELGLGVSLGSCSAWVNIAPVKERDVVVCSPNIQSGAETVYEILSRLIASGTNNFTIAAIPSPAYFGGVDHRYRSWPAVVWRLVDRGDVRVRHSDMGGAELFGSTIIAADPWQIRTVLMADTEENTAAAGKE